MCSLAFAMPISTFILADPVLYTKIMVLVKEPCSTSMNLLTLYIIFIFSAFVNILAEEAKAKNKYHYF